MHWLRFAVLILAVTVLQASVVNTIAVTTLDIKPDLLLILLVFFAIYRNTKEAIITSFTIGFAADIIGPVMGPQVISFGLFGTLLAYFHRVIAIRKMPYQSLAIFLMGVLSAFLAHLLSLLKSRPSEVNTFAVIFGISIYSSIVGPFLFLPSAWWMRIKTDRFSRH